MYLTQVDTDPACCVLQPMDQAPLRNSDVLIMCSLSQTPMANPDAMIGEFCVNAGESRTGGWERHFKMNLFVHISKGI